MDARGRRLSRRWIQRCGSALISALGTLCPAPSEGATIDELARRFGVFDQAGPLEAPAQKAELRAIQEGLAAFLSSPESMRAADLLGRSAKPFGWAEGVDLRDLDAAMRVADDPPSLAMAVAERCEYSLHAPRALSAALKVRPTHAGLLACLARSGPDGTWELTFLERAAEMRNLSAEFRSAILGRILSGLADFGLAQEMISLVDSLKPGVREQVLSARGESEIEVEGVKISLPHRDLHLDLEAARQLVGHRRLPASSFSKQSSLPIRGELDERREAPPDEDLERELLARRTVTSNEDPFEFFVDWLIRRDHPNDHDYPLSSCIWGRLASDFAQHEGYGNAARALEENCRWRFEWPDGEFDGDLPAQLSPDLRRMLAKRRKTLRAEVPEFLAPPVVEELIGRRRIDPDSSPWAQEISASQLPRADSSAWSNCGTADQPQVKPKLPSGFDLVRCEALGPRRVAIALSQRFDRTGEVTPGGYWVLRSDDAGRTWERFYTALRSYRPYVVLPESGHPMVGETGLAVEVEIREIDESTVSFPPLESKAKRRVSGLGLILPWSELERDRDADGLTDLEEIALLTDPEDSDTDADGMADSSDGLPGIPFAVSNQPQGELLGFLLEEYGVGPLRGIQIAPVTDSSSARCCTSIPNDRNLEVPPIFVEGNPRDWQGFHSETQIVILTPEESARLGKIRGGFYPVMFDLLFLDRAGERGYAVVGEAWRCTTYYLERRDGRWTASILSFVIT